ncbi:hypothetical protein M431DRAFT_190954 [Trichoderma harzianum CBS 226.95]|uniref:Uncharacterized protein n=1 Tax=Trichoderma harzianum CBS 226.95 TaxID=983964 RepID=A0A2T4AU76_TRIHA|nr:hypothetical protein M431DRAFT_190954 [Trichoderma harzianum CBS 226.95]PTB60606.1 hypothetical protein M431DRAFT_190954 [Trichoderma harzianum CBS 226.95]
MLSIRYYAYSCCYLPSNWWYACWRGERSHTSRVLPRIGRGASIALYKSTKVCLGSGKVLGRDAYVFFLLFALAFAHRHRIQCGSLSAPAHSYM